MLWITDCFVSALPYKTFFTFVWRFKENSSFCNHEKTNLLMDHEKKKISCTENFLLVCNWWVKILQIMFCSSPIQSLLIKNLFIFDTTSFLLPICYSLLSLFLYLFISRVPPWALNTVELTESGLPDRKQLVSVRLNSLRPKAAKTTLCLLLLKEAIWSCSCAHHKLSPIMTGPLTRQAGPVHDRSERSMCRNTVKMTTDL